MSHVLLPDTWHFHRRNFGSLFDHLKAADIPITVERSRRGWWKRHGDYRPLRDRLAPKLAALSGLPPEELLSLTHQGVAVMDCARGELLCLLLPRPRWRDGWGANDAATVLHRAWEDAEDREDLLLCLAAAMDWIEFWTAFLADRPAITHALTFSGSYIYTHTLLKVARRAGRRTFVLETFFTGLEYYLEERDEPLPNRSALGQEALRPALPTDPDTLDALRAEAHRRLARMRNKNVKTRPLEVVAPPFPDRAVPTVLILGQVLNDFSLIGTPLAEGSALAQYRALIGGILERTPCRVIFKGHPWERRRENLRRPATMEALADFVATLPAAHRERVRLLEREPIRGVFRHVDTVVALCSQGALEACQDGFRPAQIGHAFFGRQGFTSDLDGPQAFIDALAGGALAPRLDIPGYRAFEDFLVRALLLHLVPAHGAEGAAKAAAHLFGGPWPAAASALPPPGPRWRTLVTALRSPYATGRLLVARLRA